MRGVMANATYDTKNERFVLTYKKGDGTGVLKKRETDHEFAKLGKREQKKILVQKQLEAQKLEDDEKKQARMTAAERARKEAEKNKAFSALRTRSRYCDSENKTEQADGKRIVGMFADWLEAHHKETEITQVDRTIAKEYIFALKEEKYANSTIKKHVARLRWLFTDIQEEMPAANGFGKPKELLKRLPRAHVQHKDIFTPEMLASVFNLSIFGGLIKSERARFNFFAVLYFATMTGWRKADICAKKWEDIDLEKGLIFNRHKKTSRTSGIETTLPLTETGKRILVTLRDMNGENNGFLFSIAQGKTGKSTTTSATNYLTKARNKLNLGKTTNRGKHNVNSISFHSLRGTVVSYLTANKQNSGLVHSHVGHAPNGVEEKSYMTFAPEDYREAVEQLEAAYIPAALPFGILPATYTKIFEKYILPVEQYAKIFPNVPAKFATGHLQGRFRDIGGGAFEATPENMAALLNMTGEEKLAKELVKSVNAARRKGTTKKALQARFEADNSPRAFGFGINKHTITREEIEAAARPNKLEVMAAHFSANGIC